MKLDFLTAAILATAALLPAGLFAQQAAAPAPTLTSNPQQAAAPSTAPAARSAGEPLFRTPQPTDTSKLSPEDRYRLAWADNNRNYPRANVDGAIITSFDVRKIITPLIPAIARAAEQNRMSLDAQINLVATQEVQGFTDRKVLKTAFYEMGGRFPNSFVESQIEEKIQMEYNGDRNAYLNVLQQRGMTPIDDRKMTEEYWIFQHMMREASKYLGEISPKRIAEFYEKNKAERFTRTEQIRYRQITLSPGAAETNADIFAQRDFIINELNKKTPFHELVPRFFNKDQQRMDDGGAQTWRNASDINEKIVAVLKALPDGGVSDVVDLTGPDGRANLFFFQRVEHRAGGVVPLVEVQDLIAAEIMRNEQNAAAEQMLERYRKKYFIRFY